MAARHILIIHEAGTLQKLLKNYILSELNEVIAVEANSFEEAANACEKQKFAVILSSSVISGKDATEIKTRLSETPKNKNTPFIVVTSAHGAGNLEGITAPGAQHSLVFPFSPKELSTKINLVSTSKSRREFERCYILDATAILHTYKGTLEAGILNMSLGGVLCDFFYDVDYNQIFQAYEMTINFSEAHGNVSVAEIPVQFLYVHGMSWNRNHTPKYMRSAWQFRKISRGHKTLLKQLFEASNKELESLIKGQ